MNKDLTVCSGKGGLKGVTLIELIIVIVIVGILVGVSAMYVREVIDLWNVVSFRNELVSQARIAVLRMTREVRQIANSTAVYTANSSALRFFDADTNDITYCLANYNQNTGNCTCAGNGTYVCRNNQVLLSGVSNFTLTYYNLENNVVAAPKVYPNQTEIRRVSVGFNISQGNQTKRVIAQAALRNN